MESAWSNGKAAYRCRHGYTTASAPSPQRPRNAYVREDLIVAHLPALHLLLTGSAGRQRRRRTRRGIDVGYQAAEGVISYLREQQIILTFDPASGTLHAGTVAAVIGGVVVARRVPRVRRSPSLSVCRRSSTYRMSGSCPIVTRLCSSLRRSRQAP